MATTLSPPNCVHTLEPVATGERCEMGDEEGCNHSAIYLLHAPTCYVRPLRCCDSHGADEIFYGGAVIVAPEGLPLSASASKAAALANIGASREYS